MAKFNNTIVVPFATGGDKMNIPETTTDGSINYTDGFSTKYGIPITEGGLYIPRNGINKLFYQSQAAIKELQDKTVLSVNGALPDVNGQVTLSMTAIPGLITNANGVYLKHARNSLTWGNSDFSRVYSSIVSDSAAIAIRGAGIYIQCLSPETVTYALNVNRGIYMDGILGFNGAADLTPVKNIGLAIHGRVGIDIAPDSTYALKVGGNTHINGGLIVKGMHTFFYDQEQCGQINLQVPQGLVNQIFFRARSTGGSLGAFGKDWFHSVETLVSGIYLNAPYVGINTPPDSAYALKVEGKVKVDGYIEITENITFGSISDAPQSRAIFFYIKPNAFPAMLQASYSTGDLYYLNPLTGKSTRLTA